MAESAADSRSDARSRVPDPVLSALAAELRSEESVISPHVIEPAAGDRATLGGLAAVGPATAGDPSYAPIIEAVREGYLLHYGRPRLIQGADRDLMLLAGDYMYAKGLERLAALGDLSSVRELSDLISLAAQLHAADPDAATELAGVLWLASSVAIATGPSEAHESAKAELRDGRSVQPMFAAATAAAASAGLDEQLAAASETVGLSPSNLG